MIGALCSGGLLIILLRDWDIALKGAKAGKMRPIVAQVHGVCFCVGLFWFATHTIYEYRENRALAELAELRSDLPTSPD